MLTASLDGSISCQSSQFEGVAMIVVTTPTGKIGSHVVSNLLSAGASLRLIVRDPSKLPPDVRDRVQIVKACLDDESSLDSAFEGAEGAFLLVPPSLKDNNDAHYYLRFTQPALRAIKRRGVKRIVGVSVLGRGTDLSKHAGPVTAAFAKDQAIEESGVDYHALWCPALMDNMLGNLQSIREQGMFSSPSDPSLKVPQVATKDVGMMAAKFLLDFSWYGQGGSAVLGPEDLSFDDVASIMTTVLGRSVRYRQIPEDAFRAQLIQHGTNTVFAQGIVDMLIAKNKGLDNLEARTSENTTPTGFAQWCEEVLKPAMLN